MILVTGASGHLGRAIVERLLERIPGNQIAVSVRDPEEASALAERGSTDASLTIQVPTLATATDAQPLAAAVARGSRAALRPTSSARPAAPPRPRGAFEH